MATVRISNQLVSAVSNKIHTMRNTEMGVLEKERAEYIATALASLPYDTVMRNLWKDQPTRFMPGYTGDDAVLLPDDWYVPVQFADVRYSVSTTRKETKTDRQYNPETGEEFDYTREMDVPVSFNITKRIDCRDAYGALGYTHFYMHPRAQGYTPDVILNDLKDNPEWYASLPPDLYDQIVDIHLRLAEAKSRYTNLINQTEQTLRAFPSLNKCLLVYPALANLVPLSYLSEVERKVERHTRVQIDRASPTLDTDTLHAAIAITNLIKPQA